jgi:hypothetical protein
MSFASFCLERSRESFLYSMSIIKKTKQDSSKGSIRKGKPTASSSKVGSKNWSKDSKDKEFGKNKWNKDKDASSSAKKPKDKRWSKKGEEDVDAEEFETVGIDFKNEEDVEEVSDESEEDEDVMERHDARDKKDIERKIQANNRKGSKTGGFQSMGLSPNVFKAITHKGYKIPTPIQRKVFSYLFLIFASLSP